MAQPLHISLSRPLTLKTNQKECFLARLQDALVESSVKAVDVQVKNLTWHPNESQTRWFLVLQLETSSNLSKLLDLCNRIAKQFDQSLLYANSELQDKSDNGDPFHISIAWSLQPQVSQEAAIEKSSVQEIDSLTGISYSLLSQLASLPIHFSEVKVRIGQDVHSIALKPRRQSTG